MRLCSVIALGLAVVALAGSAHGEELLTPTGAADSFASPLISENRSATPPVSTDAFGITGCAGTMEIPGCTLRKFDPNSDVFPYNEAEEYRLEDLLLNPHNLQSGMRPDSLWYLYGLTPPGAHRLNLDAALATRAFQEGRMSAVPECNCGDEGSIFSRSETRDPARLFSDYISNVELHDVICKSLSESLAMSSIPCNPSLRISNSDLQAALTRTDALIHVYTLIIDGRSEHLALQRLNNIERHTFKIIFGFDSELTPTIYIFNYEPLIKRSNDLTNLEKAYYDPIKENGSELNQLQDRISAAIAAELMRSLIGVEIKTAGIQNE